MLRLTERAQQQLKVALADGELASARLRVFIDHRCHCGKAHFSLALEEEPRRTALDIAKERYADGRVDGVWGALRALSGA